MSQGAKKIVFWLAMLIVVFIGLVVLYLVIVYPQHPLLLSGVDSSAYQAVFLTNGQVYFGHVTSLNSQYPTLTKVYYLQVTQPPQPIQPGQANAQQANINLVKLGGELHGPTDQMLINRDQVLFIENLRPDSGVVKAIEQLSAAASK